MNILGLTSGQIVMDSDTDEISFPVCSYSGGAGEGSIYFNSDIQKYVIRFGLPKSAQSYRFIAICPLSIN